MQLSHLSRALITLALIVSAAPFLTSCSGGSSSGGGSAATSVNTCFGLTCMETVNVGNTGNLADTDTGYGSVSYNYAIGKNEITVSQYLTFLNAVAQITSSSAIRDLWNSDMFKPTYATSGLIGRAGSGTSSDPYIYSEIPEPLLGANSGLRGIMGISWFSAARFANWLHNGATEISSTETGAYTLNGATSGVFLKNADARWWIPSEDEWYKAAYYDPSKGDLNKYWKYPTRSNAVPTAEAPAGGSNSANYNSPLVLENNRITPVGAYTTSVSYYGTYDQAGLMWEWNDAAYTDFDGNPLTRGMRGGSWSLGIINVSKFGPRDYGPSYEDDDSGFRIATSSK